VNQKGDVNLLMVLSLLVMSGLMILLSIELKVSLDLLQKRKKLFLCARETQGEHKNYLKVMGRTNWGIKNASRVALITLFIPGLQGVASNARKVKKYLQHYQNFKLASYLKTLHSLRQKSCPIDPRMNITPYELTTSGYKRDSEGVAKLRKRRWDYIFIDRPYLLKMTFEDKALDSLHPEVDIKTSESAVMSHFLSRSR
jgi:hypothetical protein